MHISSKHHAHPTLRVGITSMQPELAQMSSLTIVYQSQYAQTQAQSVLSRDLQTSRGSHIVLIFVISGHARRSLIRHFDNVQYMRRAQGQKQSRFYASGRKGTVIWHHLGVERLHVRLLAGCTRYWWIRVSRNRGGTLRDQRSCR